MPKRLSLPALMIAGFVLAGCAAPGTPPEAGRHAGHHGSGMGGQMGGHMGGQMGGHAGGHMGGGGGHGQMAVASLSPTQGQNVQGLVMFHQREGQLMVHARVSGLKPNAEHGFHVHEGGSCASTDGSSAGGHFNPDGKPHGPQTGDRHVGDMPSLKADPQGHADLRFMLNGASLGAGAARIVGRAVIVHAQPDDYTTQPTGNAGARLACGVIAAH